MFQIRYEMLSLSYLIQDMAIYRDKFVVIPYFIHNTLYLVTNIAILFIRSIRKILYLSNGILFLWCWCLVVCKP